MTERSRYILAQDTEMMFSKIHGNTEGRFGAKFFGAIDNHKDVVTSSLSTAFGADIEVQAYSQSQIDDALKARVTGELIEDPKTVCICLDRHLLADIENVDLYQQRFFRFDICRTLDGKKTPRQGGALFSIQFDMLRESIPELDQKQLVIIDSGIFSGGTIKEFLALLSDDGIKAPVKKIICFVGEDKNDEDSELGKLEIVEPVSKLLDWVDIRDFSLLGGKKLSSSKSNRVSASAPYLYPWSDGSDASLSNSPNLFTVSQHITEAFREIVRAYNDESGKKPLTFKELIRSGFSLPTSLLKNLPVSISDDVVEYLDRCVDEISREQNRQVVVFDMDGTLYELDGEQGRFRGSTLDRQVIKNAKLYISAKEGCTDIQAVSILQAGLEDDIGLSAYLSRRYGVTRKEYFNTVWDISPEGIIKNSEHATETILALKENPQLKIVLLTHAPRVWANQVLRYLGIDDRFESIFSGDEHSQKDEIFALLAGRYKPTNIISIGDQYETDIKPAEKLGMKTLLVRSPDDIKGLLKMLNL